MQETDPKYSDAEVVEALDPEDSNDDLFQLGGYSDHSKEPPGKVLVKDNHSKIRNDGEEVIQAARNLVYLGQMIKGEEEVGRKNRGGGLESEIKWDKGDKQDDLETVGQENSSPPNPPVPPRRIQQTSVPTSCYAGTRAQERWKANNVAVGRLKKVDNYQLVDGGSTSNRGAREVKVCGAKKGVKAGRGSGRNGDGQEKGVTSGGGSDMIKKMVLQGGCVGDDGGRDVGKRVGSSIMASYITKKRRIKQMGSSSVKGN